MLTGYVFSQGRATGARGRAIGCANRKKRSRVESQQLRPPSSTVDHVTYTGNVRFGWNFFEDGASFIYLDITPRGNGASLPVQRDPNAESQR